MSMTSKILIGLAGLAFLLAVFSAKFWPVLNVPAEGYSRAANNLALIAIALTVCSNPGSKGS
jgi:hypothetical protein